MVTQEKIGIDERINEAFQPISNFWEGLILHEFFGTGIPTIIFLLVGGAAFFTCLLYTSPSPRDYAASRMPSSA